MAEPIAMQDSLVILPETLEFQNSSDDNDDTQSIASVHSEYSDQNKSHQQTFDQLDDRKKSQNNNNHGELVLLEPEASVNANDESNKYDRIMTGWDELAPTAGHKRNRSPEPEITTSKQGRPIKKVDYYKLHHVKVAKSTDDPRT